MDTDRDKAVKMIAEVAVKVIARAVSASENETRRNQSKPVSNLA